VADQFEARFDELFRDYAAQGVRPIDRFAIAVAAIAAAPHGHVRVRQSPRLSWSWRLAAAVLLTLILVAAGAVLVGTHLNTPIPVPPTTPPPTNLAILTTPAVATPSVTPSGPIWTETGGLAKGRRGHTATLLIDGRVLVVGGDTTLNGDATATAEMYEPATGTWTTVAPTVLIHSKQTATRLQDGTVLVAGGTGTAFAETYEPATGRWTATGSMSAVRTDHTATLLPDGRVLVAGGFDAGAQAEIYDPATRSWRATGHMVDRRWGHTATALLDGRVLAVGGYSGLGNQFLEHATAELYDPTTQTWSAAAPPPKSFVGHTATLLLDGTVLVTGGWHSSSGAIEAWAVLYDPKRDSWARVADLMNARGGHTATRLDNGSVLVVGGFSNGSIGCGNILAGAELFDPLSRTWSPAEPLVAGPRYAHVATLLLDGTVLVTGGTDSGCMHDPLTSVELYVPGNS
jgi:Kelch motif/Galactose oxidase, central domain